MSKKEENKGGRPPKFQNEQELEDKIKEYFQYIKGEYHFETVSSLNKKTGEEKEIEIKVFDREEEPPTITGLALFLGFSSRQSFYDYEDNAEFSYTIKRARMRIENSYEKNLYNDKPIGSIFALKNLGWKDKHEVEQSGTKKYVLLDGSEGKDVEEDDD